MANTFAQSFVPTAPGMDMFGQEFAEMEQKQQEKKLFNEFQKALGAKPPPAATTAAAPPDQNAPVMPVDNGIAPPSSLGGDSSGSMGAVKDLFEQAPTLMDAVKLYLGGS